MLKTYSTVTLLIFFVFGFILQSEAQTCNNPLDIHIANDISGSVNSSEYQQSKTFITNLALSLPLGTGATESKIGISQWSSGINRFEEYNFPTAGETFTTSNTDIISYVNSARPFSGGTDPYTALQKAYNWVLQNPTPGRTAQPVIVLLTDASCGQLPSNLSALAMQIKNNGVIIAVLAIDAASSCTSLQGTNVASPGAYFSAANYNTLQQNATTYIQSLTTSICNAATFEPNLSVNISSFEIISCNTTPAATANFTVTNKGALDFSGTLDVAFYNGDPTLPTTQYLFTDSSSQGIISGGSYSGSSSNDALLDAGEIYAVVNIDGSLATNAVPISPSLTGAILTDTTENIVANNISNGFTRTAGAGCVAYAQLDVQVSHNGVACDNQVNYTIQVCNTGTADATVDTATYLTAYAPADFTLLDSALIGASPFVGNKLPIGKCATYTYTYNLDNAVATTSYNFSVDVKSSIDDPCRDNTTAVVDVMAAGYTWMDRNLGASRVATSSTDALAYGDLYQWGRCADGHEKRTSGTTLTNATTAVPNAGNSWDGLFIIEANSPNDWLIPSDNTLWQGVNGTNNPCPAGYRIPNRVELEALGNSFSPGNITGGFASPLKMTMGGIRVSNNGSIVFTGGNGYYRTSTGSAFLDLDPNNSRITFSFLANGHSIRCIKD